MVRGGTTLQHGATTAVEASRPLADAGTRRRQSAHSDADSNRRTSQQGRQELDADIPTSSRAYPISGDGGGSSSVARLDGWGEIGAMTQKLDSATSRVQQELPEPGPMEIIHGLSPYVSCPDIRSSTHNLDEWDSEADRASWFDDFHKKTRPDVLHMAHSARGLDASMITHEHMLDPQLLQYGDEWDAHQHVRNAATSVLSCLDHLSPGLEGGRNEPGPGHQLHTQLRTAAAGVFENLTPKPAPVEPPFVLPDAAGKDENSPKAFMKDQDNSANAYYDAHHNVRNVCAEVMANLNVMATEPKLEAVMKEMEARKRPEGLAGLTGSIMPPRQSQAVRLSSVSQGGRSGGSVRKSAQHKPSQSHHPSQSKHHPSQSQHHASTSSNRPSASIRASRAGPASQQVGGGGGRSTVSSKMPMNWGTSVRSAGPGAFMFGGGGEDENDPMPELKEGDETEGPETPAEEGDENDGEGSVGSDFHGPLWPDGVNRDNFGDTFLQSALVQMSAVYKVAKEDISERARKQREHREKASCWRSEANVLRARADDYWAQIQEGRRQLRAMYPALRLDNSDHGPPKLELQSPAMSKAESSLGFEDTTSPRLARKNVSSLARPSAVASFGLQQVGGGGSRRGSASTLGDGACGKPSAPKSAGAAAAKPAPSPKAVTPNASRTPSSQPKRTLQKNATITSGSLLLKRNKLHVEGSTVVVGPPVRQKGNDEPDRLLSYEEEFPLRAPSEASALSTQPSWSSLASWKNPSSKISQSDQAIPLAPPEPAPRLMIGRLLRNTSNASLASSGAMSEVTPPGTPPMAPEERIPAIYQNTVRLTREPLDIIEEMVRCVNKVGHRRSHCTDEAHEVTVPDAGLTNAISSLLATTDLRAVECEKKNPVHSPDIDEFDF